MARIGRRCDGTWLAGAAGMGSEHGHHRRAAAASWLRRSLLLAGQALRARPQVGPFHGLYELTWRDFQGSHSLEVPISGTGVGCPRCGSAGPERPADRGWRRMAQCRRPQPRSVPRPAQVRQPFRVFPKRYFRYDNRLHPDNDSFNSFTRCHHDKRGAAFPLGMAHSLPACMGELR